MVSFDEGEWVGLARLGGEMGLLFLFGVGVRVERVGWLGEGGKGGKGGKGECK